MRRSHVEHDWKDRSLKLLDRVSEMQERINNLESALDDETAYSSKQSEKVALSQDQLNHDWKLFRAITIWFSVSLLTNLVFIAGIIIRWRH